MKGVVIPCSRPASSLWECVAAADRYREDHAYFDVYLCRACHIGTLFFDLILAQAATVSVKSRRVKRVSCPTSHFPAICKVRMTATAMPYRIHSTSTRIAALSKSPHSPLKAQAHTGSHNHIVNTTNSLPTSLFVLHKLHSNKSSVDDSNKI